MSNEDPTRSDRISFELPLVPHALRAFIERAVRDEHLSLAFVESPGHALRAAGVPVDTDCLTRSDCSRLAQVIGNLRTLVANGKLAQDFRFEDVFTISPEVAYQEQRESTESHAYHNFDHSEDGQSAENKSRTEGGIKDNFDKKGMNFEDIFAPLINPGDLAAIATLMQRQIRMLE